MGERKEVDLIGCFPWIVYVGLMAIAFALFSVAAALRALHS